MCFPEHGFVHVTYFISTKNVEAGLSKLECHPCYIYTVCMYLNLSFGKLEDFIVRRFIGKKVYSTLKRHMHFIKLIKHM